MKSFVHLLSRSELLSFVFHDVLNQSINPVNLLGHWPTQTMLLTLKYDLYIRVSMLVRQPAAATVRLDVQWDLAIHPIILLRN